MRQSALLWAALAGAALAGPAAAQSYTGDSTRARAARRAITSPAGVSAYLGTKPSATLESGIPAQAPSARMSAEPLPPDRPITSRNDQYRSGPTLEIVRVVPVRVTSPAWYHDR